MCDLHQIVDLGAASDPGLTESRTIDANVGTELYVVFQNHDPNLRHLVVGAVNGCKTKPVRADHCSRVDNTAVPELTIFLHDHPRVENTVCAYSGVAPQNAAGTNDAAVSDGCAGRNRNQRTDACAFANRNVVSHNGRRMHSGIGTLHRVEDLERLRESEIRFWADEEIPSGKSLGIGDQDCTGCRRLCLLHIFRVVEKAQVLGLRGIEWPDATDLQIPVTDHIGTEIGGEICEFSTRGHCAVLNI